MQSVKVWDPFVRIFHWGTALLFLANFAVFEDDGAAHRYAGYLLFGLVLLRILWGLVGTKYARFNAFWPSLRDIKEHFRGLLNRDLQPHLSHNPLGALMVYNLLIALILISVTGIMMGSDTFWGVAWVEEAHELIANYAIVCVGLHIAGVIFESRRSKINLVKAMVTGQKNIPG
ncbi:cytochrome b/b6 domain-containing protein [Pelagibius sp. Alg239-R121]|uniref:cytochrome b/b6 domain-containing protein n=1 Tax=Pelagibius sp. Alg239-R121 TaxID=2993448 RepID=UPI0024A6164C|nr:cytochrome b/b6 domain-containing protein [Pelagibius sp. Alg239-R121]